MKQLRPPLKVVVSDDDELFTHCQFPTGPDSKCGCELPHPDRRRKYCDNPDHTALRALRLKQHYQRKAELERQAAPTPNPRPVSGGVETLSRLVDRMNELREEFAATLTDAGQLLSVVCEPAAVDHEVSAVRREANIRVTEAETAQAAEALARQQAEQKAAEALEMQRLALDAAEEAIAKSDECEFRSERIAKQAADRITAVVDDRDRIRLEADTAIAAMEEELDEARTERTRAETERDTAIRDTDTARAETTQLRAELDTQQRAHHTNVEDLHATHALALAEAHKLADQSAREQRSQHAKQLTIARDDYREQLGQVRADLDLARKNIAALTTANTERTAHDSSDSDSAGNGGPAPERSFLGKSSQRR